MSTLHWIKLACECLFVASVGGFGFYEHQLWKRGKR